MTLQSLAQSYLFAYIFWLGLPLGSLFFLAVHRLTGGRWGRDLGAVLRSTTATLPLMVVLFIPILFFLPQLYPWLPDSVLPGSGAASVHPLYQSRLGFGLRAAVYFSLWLFFAWRLRREQPAGAERGLAAVSILVLFISASLAAVDWLMSLEPHWYSSVYGLILLTSAGLCAMALAIGVTARRTKRRDDVTQDSALLPSPAGLYAEEKAEEAQGDLATLLMVTLMACAYAHFSQLLIMWSGNKPDEMVWYDARYHGAWRAIAWLIIVGAYALPFVLLLFRRIKRHGPRILVIAALILCGQIVTDYWLIVPSYGRGGGSWFQVSDVLFIPLFGAAWVWLFRRGLPGL